MRCSSGDCSVEKDGQKEDSNVKLTMFGTVLSLALLGFGCVHPASESDLEEETATAEDRLSTRMDCSSLADPGLSSAELARLVDSHPDCEDLVEAASDADAHRRSSIGGLTTGVDDPTPYACGVLTCTCFNTTDCMVMAWEKTDGPCVNNGSSGKTCCIDADC
ncbi:MAG: hypothetical protein U0271_00400 [Polyangiaceae bacterium]